MTAPVRTRSGALVATAIPVAAVAAVWLDGWSLSPSAPVAVRAQSAAAVFVLETAFAVVIAPLAGVVMGCRSQRGWTIAAGALIGTLVFCATSLIVQVIIARAIDVSTFGTSHVTLAIVTLALVALGAACGVSFADPLDAAACAGGVAAVAALAVLLGGPLVELLPRAALGVGLLANPIVATASAARIDLFRTELLYQLSPVAHMQVDYPTASAACLAYAALALLLFTGTGLQLARRVRAASLERMSA